MNGSRLKQAMHYQLNYFGWSSLYVYGISIAVITAVTLGIGFTITVNGEGFSSGIGGVCFFHLLVIGIGGIRSDLKFFLQNGIGRRTTFLSNLYGSLICALALGLLRELFVLVGGIWINFAGSGPADSVLSFLLSWMGHTFLFFFAWQIGALISLIYYRMGKMQQIVFSVVAIAAVVFAFSNGIRHLVGAGDAVEALIDAILLSPGNIASPVIWVVLLVAVVAAAGNFLLIRRAQVKE